MPDMPNTVAKGALLKSLDGALRNPDIRAHVLGQLQSGTPLLDILQDPQNQVTMGPDDVRHLGADWFGAHWWPEAQAGVGAIEQLLRAGFIDAINKSNELGVPIDTYWICHPGHGHGSGHITQTPGPEQHVEVTVLWSAQQVTVIIHTPEPGDPSVPHQPQTIDEPIKVWFWENNQVQMQQPKHRP